MSHHAWRSVKRLCLLSPVIVPAKAVRTTHPQIDHRPSRVICLHRPRGGDTYPNKTFLRRIEEEFTLRKIQNLPLGIQIFHSRHVQPSDTTLDKHVSHLRRP